jgi:hypothetical protein
MKEVKFIAEKFESGEMAVYQRETRCSDKDRWVESIVRICNSALLLQIDETFVSSEYINQTWAEYVKLSMGE